MKKPKSKAYQGGRGLSAQVHNEIAQFPTVWELMDNGRLVISIQAPLGTTERQLVEGLLDLASILCHDAGFTPDSIMSGLNSDCLPTGQDRLSPMMGGIADDRGLNRDGTRPLPFA